MILQAVKQALRISHNALDLEITDLIAASRLDLIQSGVATIKANNDSDPLIKRAITLYTKAHFLPDNDEANRYQESYNLLKIHLSLAGDYREMELVVMPVDE